MAVLERTEVKPIAGGRSDRRARSKRRFLTIQELPGRKLVTVIEVLSPTNKKTKDARAEYLEKRRDLIRSRVNLVEIDLLRAGEPMPLRDAAAAERLSHPDLPAEAGAKRRSLRVSLDGLRSRRSRSRCCPEMPSRPST